MEPKTLKAAIEYFSDPQNVREYMVAHRWPDGVECPRCGSRAVKYSEKHNRWQCGSHHERRQFTLKTGTIFEESPLGLDKWLTAMWLLVNSKNGISSWEVSRTLGVTQKSAWFMVHRLRSVLQDDTVRFEKNGTPVQVDEAFIGGKARNMHKEKRLRLGGSAGLQGGRSKAIVMGMLQSGGRVKAQVIPERKRKIMRQIIDENIEKGAIVHTDEHNSYIGLSEEYVHEIINHAEAYAKHYITTNGIENFWSLLKRGLNGTYVSIEPFHLFRYIDEQAWRFNNRATKDNPLNDSDRFVFALGGVVGKRLKYSELTGKTGEARKPF